MLVSHSSAPFKGLRHVPRQGLCPSSELEEVADTCPARPGSALRHRARHAGPRPRQSRSAAAVAISCAPICRHAGSLVTHCRRAPSPISNSALTQGLARSLSAYHAVRRNFVEVTSSGLPAFAKDAREGGTSLASEIGMQQHEAKRLKRRAAFRASLQACPKLLQKERI